MTPTRMSSLLATLVLLAGCGALGQSYPGTQGAYGPHGMVSVKSSHSQAETVSRLETQVRQRNLNVTARIDHAAAAQRIGQTLRPNEVVIFGNPQAGTPLMQCAPTVGVDLPMKALVWTDADGQVWLGYNDPAWLIHRHGAPECPAADNVRKVLAAIVEATVAR
ncbi:putative inner membrane or exported protein [Polaromonas sp. CG9_12]|nr:putative inner membrane or exported protein [Polaromonas sp. CG9_12]